jgi:hypothetical protein
VAQKSPKNAGVYDMPYPAPQYREVRMVADDGVVLVEIRVHERAQRAQGKDLIPVLREWRSLICEYEARAHRNGLTLVTSEPVDEKVS